MKSGTSQTRYVKSDSVIRVYPNGGMEFTATEKKIAFVNITYKNVPASTGKKITDLSYDYYGTNKSVELKDNEEVTTKMSVNGTSFSFKTAGDGGYLDISSIEFHLAD